MHIIVTTTSITTKFCTVIKTTKHSCSWVVQNVRKEIENGRRIVVFDLFFFFICRACLAAFYAK